MKLTEAAELKVSQLLEQEDPDLFLRIGVQPGGCSGLKYQIYFDNIAENDEVLSCRTFKVHIDKMSWPYLIGATMDFKDSINAQGFVIDNPNAQGSCACGDSFN